MTRTEIVGYMTDIMVRSVGYSGKVLPDDVTERLKEFGALETGEPPETIYDTMLRSQELAAQLGHPCRQDTGALQYPVKRDTRFPPIDFVESLLKEATVRATFDASLRHNSVETFDEYNTGKNVGKGTPTVFWKIVPGCDICEIYSYMAGGRCSLPEKAVVLMPGQGYEGITKFMLDIMTSYGLNVCPPLLVGAGVATSMETATLLSKRVLFRTLGSKDSNERAAKLKEPLEDGTNGIGLGLQGVSGKISVMGVHIENTTRHPSTTGVAVNVGCWFHRKGYIIFDKGSKYTTISYKGMTL